MEEFKIGIFLNQLNQKLEDISNQLNELKKGSKENLEAIKEFNKDLALAQGEMPLAKYNKDNPFFKSKYADFASIVSASRPVLSKYGFSVKQDLATDERGKTYLVTRLKHKGGHEESSRVILQPKKQDDPQSLSSYNSYMRRVTYASLIGIATGDDDDAEKAVNRDPKISFQQVQKLNDELKGFPKLYDRIVQSLSISSLQELPQSKYNRTLERIKEVKKSQR